MVMRPFYSMVMFALVAIVLVASVHGAGSSSTKKSVHDLNYMVFPQRKAEEAAVVEWGNSAIISAVEAAVADFGPQTSLGAYFEVETGTVLADPIDGNLQLKSKSSSSSEDDDDEDDPLLSRKFRNAAEVEGNMVLMTNAADMSGVEMAAMAQASGAAALMVVNVLDTDTPDYIYSLAAETPEEAAWAEEHVDIPVVMVSLASGNVLTSANPSDASGGGGGLPERVRLYAGGDRPFFEDVSPGSPMVYLIHNLLTDEECDELIRKGENSVPHPSAGRLEGATDHVHTSSSSSAGGGGGGDPADNDVIMGEVDQVFLWSGRLGLTSSIDERMEQVTGYPTDHASDFLVSRFGHKSGLAPHYDHLRPDSSDKNEDDDDKKRRRRGRNSNSQQYDLSENPARVQTATVTVFLNDFSSEEEGGNGGEIVYPAADPPIKIRPKKGMAVVHHNVQEDGPSSSSNSNPSSTSETHSFILDRASVHAELPYYAPSNGDSDNTANQSYKWTAKRWIHAAPISTARRMVLPVLAFPNKGRLPSPVRKLYIYLQQSFGKETGDLYFDYAIFGLPLLLAVLLVTLIGNFLESHFKASSSSKTSSSTSTTGTSASSTKKKKKKTAASSSSAPTKSSTLKKKE